MERVKQAIETAKAQGLSISPPSRSPAARPASGSPLDADQLASIPEVFLSDDVLDASRIVAHRPASPFSAPFDMLRTQTLQKADANGWQTVLISSPTPGCGKSVTAINLAISIARVPERRVILLDLDFRKPLVGKYLGLSKKVDFRKFLSGEAEPVDCFQRVRAGSSAITLLAGAQPVRNPAELMGSREMSDFLEALKASQPKSIIIIDCPPMLACDDVLAILPQVDCAMLAIAERVSKFDEVSACERQLQAANYLGIVLTKSHEVNNSYYYY